MFSKQLTFGRSNDRNAFLFIVNLLEKVGIFQTYIRG